MASTVIPQCGAPEGFAHEDRLDVFLQTAEQRRAQLLHIARRITNSSEDSEDIVQDAYLKAYQALPRFRGESKMSTWLSAIVQNTALEYLRSRRGRVFLSIEYVGKEGDEVVVQDFPDTRATPEENCAQREIENMVYDEIGKLTHGCRSAIELCALDGRSQSFAARALHVRTETVKSRVFRGKRILHEMVARRMKKRSTARPETPEPRGEVAAD
ncbi:MAG: sigma-70 family RNA polymerase sigma factor [Terracidiphilus sp.]